ncbi:hypothetical protein [Candidatus Nitrotoga sp. M5]|uniref:hypothetical protein n=1 Tax=Candidatus Nitrotoga sp. M5 TaxID=2890409 RepID=UPI001EF1B5C7|nr:hypothetical protein [Candidatus Nitrotoga sp. M5]CAH1385916.1 conserved hypothetical protein [Candidatus Nitrotoga sp. M5]
MKQYQVEMASNTYEYLWSVCEKAMEDAQQTTGSPWYYYFTAMTMAYFCYEAFLNHVLHLIAPETFSNEKEFFSKAPYKGTEGKLRKVCEVAGVIFPNKGDATYQQIRLLKSLRDFVAHGKTEMISMVVEASNGPEAINIQSTLHELITKQNAEKSICSIKEFIISLNKEVRNKTYCDRLALFPLQGMSAFGSASEIQP